MKKTKGRNRVLPLLLAAGLLVFGVFAFQRLKPDVEKAVYPRHYREIVEREAKAFGLEDHLVYAVIKAESGFRKNAVSSAGALGLMQMTPGTFEWMQTHLGGPCKEEDLFDPAVSIRFGCGLLRLLLDEYGSLPVALSAYNAGMGNVTSWLSDPACSPDGVTLTHIPFAETRLYVERVLRYKATYDQIYGGMENG